MIADEHVKIVGTKHQFNDVMFRIDKRANRQCHRIKE